MVRGCANANPATTNYDVDSATWADLRLASLQSAMEVANLGHGSFWSPIDPVQVSMFLSCPWPYFIIFSHLLSYSTDDVGLSSSTFAQTLIQTCILLFIKRRNNSFFPWVGLYWEHPLYLYKFCVYSIFSKLHFVRLHGDCCYCTVFKDVIINASSSPSPLDLSLI